MTEKQQWYRAKIKAEFRGKVWNEGECFALDVDDEENGKLNPNVFEKCSAPKDGGRDASRLTEQIVIDRQGKKIRKLEEQLHAALNGSPSEETLENERLKTELEELRRQNAALAEGAGVEELQKKADELQKSVDDLQAQVVTLEGENATLKADLKGIAEAAAAVDVNKNKPDLVKEVEALQEMTAELVQPADSGE